MPNSAIELHDSRVTRIRNVGADVVLDLSAYVHVSGGTPGVDAGTGWLRPVRMTVLGAVARQNFGGDAMLISDGSVRIGERTLDNMVPLNLDVAGTIEVVLVGAEGKLCVTGVALRVQPMGDAVYVEGFRRPVDG